MGRCARGLVRLVCGDDFHRSLEACVWPSPTPFGLWLRGCAAVVSFYDDSNGFDIGSTYRRCHIEVPNLVASSVVDPSSMMMKMACITVEVPDLVVPCLVGPTFRRCHIEVLNLVASAVVDSMTYDDFELPCMLHVGATDRFRSVRWRVPICSLSVSIGACGFAILAPP